MYCKVILLQGAKKQCTEHANTEYTLSKAMNAVFGDPNEEGHKGDARTQAITSCQVTSASFLAELSVSSPQKLFIFIM